jgi:hypothetical protein
MINPDSITIKSFLVPDGRSLKLRYALGENEFTHEVLVGFFQVWLVRNQAAYVDRYRHEGVVLWNDLLRFHEIPVEIKKAYIIHLEKIKADLEMEAA